MHLLRLENISLEYGVRPLMRDANLDVFRGERVCLVGRNGEGKSSLLKLVDGEIKPDSGTVWVRPGTRIARLDQEVALDSPESVYEVVSAGLSALQHEDTWQLEHRIEVILTRLGLDGEAPIHSLSGGWRRRALLARALVCEPQLLLLDEPTNHLDVEAIEWLEDFLSEWPQALLFVSHDRAFVRRLATRIVELDRGRLTSWPGNYDEYVLRKAEQLTVEAQHNALFEKKLAQEEVWIRKGVEARRTRNEGRVRALYALRDERRTRLDRGGPATFQMQQAGESGKTVFEAEDVSHAFDGKVVLRDFSARIVRGDRVGIIGPNGAGKSTLIKLLLGELTPDAGTIKFGTRLEIAYYDQQREQLDPSKSVMENVSGDSETVVVNGAPQHVSGYLRNFLFSPERLLSPVSMLSGGERNRLLLARLFAKPANLLVMDEPTNDLDVETLELLEELVSEFPGTLLLVSHDRAFLDNVVTSTLVFEGNGRVREYVGGYSDWVRQRRPVAAAPVAKPAASPPPPEPAATAKARKLSYKDQRELETLPAKIEAYETERATLLEKINDPSFYKQAPPVTQEALARLATLEQLLQESYARWEALEAAKG